MRLRWRSFAGRKYGPLLVFPTIAVDWGCGVVEVGAAWLGWTAGVEVWRS